MGNTAVVQTYISPDLKARLEAIAERTERPVSYVVRHAVTRLVEEEERKT